MKIEKSSQQKIEKSKRGKCQRKTPLLKNFSRNFWANQNIFIYLCQKYYQQTKSNNGKNDKIPD